VGIPGEPRQLALATGTYAYTDADYDVSAFVALSLEKVIFRPASTLRSGEHVGLPAHRRRGPALGTSPSSFQAQTNPELVSEGNIMRYLANTTQHGRALSLILRRRPRSRPHSRLAKGQVPVQAIWHRVVAISFVQARIEKRSDGSELYVVECCRTGRQADWDERRILTKFWEYFGGYQAVS
jgi:hypothetical protein